MLIQGKALKCLSRAYEIHRILFKVATACGETALLPPTIRQTILTITTVTGKRKVA
jgi:hypothetical protein